MTNPTHEAVERVKRILTKEGMACEEVCFRGLVHPEDDIYPADLRTIIAALDRVELFEGPVCGTDIAPVGWWCSRPVGHDGPCAAHEKAKANPLLIAEGALRTARHAILRQADTFKAEGEITTALWHIRAATQSLGDKDK